ncbi:MAG: YceD family protein [Trueperaceae bacterium]
MEIRDTATLNLAKLILRNVLDYEVEDEGLLLPSDALLEADGLHLAKPIHWQLTVRDTGGEGNFLLEGHATTTAKLECRRCLTEVQTDIATEFYYPMLYKPGSPELKLLETNDEHDETLLFGKPQVDFVELITQLLAMELPLTVLCKEDCKGLSPDGVNLNEHPEAEKPLEEAEPESPFAALRDLKL